MILRQYKRDYSPKKYDKNKSELKLIIYGIDKKGIVHKVIAYGTRPRFWIKKEEFAKREQKIHEALTNYNHEIIDEGFKSVVDDSELLTIYVEYPWHVEEIRGIFGWTGQANITYVDAVTSFYRLTPYINVPNKAQFDISEIQSIEEDLDFKFRDGVFDIETREDKEIGEEGLLVCATMEYEDAIYSSITKDIDRQSVKDALGNSDLLTEVCNTKEDTIVEKVSKTASIDFSVCDDESYPFPEECAEIRLFQWCCEHFSKIPFIMGHWVGGFDTLAKKLSGFDFPTMQKHAEARNYEISVWNQTQPQKRLYYPYPRDFVRHTQIVDTMYLYGLYRTTSVHAKGRKALDWIGLEELDCGKIQRGKIYELYREDPEFLMLYNEWDTHLLWMLFQKTNLLNLLRGYAEYKHTTIDNIGYKNRLVSSELRWELWDEKMIIPTKAYEVSEKIEVGGLVHDPPDDIFRCVLEVDNSGEYSAIIMSAKVDYRTMVHGEPEPNRPYSKFKESGNMYYLDVEGVMPKKLTWIMSERDKIKIRNKEIENLLFTDISDEEKKKLKIEKSVAKTYNDYLKFDGHSWYGLLGTIGTDHEFPLASGKIGTDITKTARSHQKDNINKINKMIATNREVVSQMGTFFDYKDFDITFTVIYGDTDGVKFIINELEKVLQFIEEHNLDERDFMVGISEVVSIKLNMGYDDLAEDLMGIQEHFLHVKAEPPLFKYIQLGAKKRYVGLDYRGEMHVKGFEMRRSNTNQFVRDIQKGIFQEMFDEKTPKQVALFILDSLERMHKGELDEKLAYGTSWKSDGNWLTPMVKWANENLDTKIRHGDKIFYFFVKPSRELPNPPKDKSHSRNILVVDWGEIPKDKGYEIDYDAHEKTFLDMKTILSIFEVYRTTYESALSGYSQSSIDNYM